jgi:hypothetical protein
MFKSNNEAEVHKHLGIYSINFEKLSIVCQCNIAFYFIISLKESYLRYNIYISI